MIITLPAKKVLAARYAQASSEAYNIRTLILMYLPQPAAIYSPFVSINIYLSNTINNFCKKTPGYFIMQLPQTNLFYRIIAILVHAVVNFIIISSVLSYDISGSWLSFFLFMLLCVTLFTLFVLHLSLFIRFLKSTST